MRDLKCLLDKIERAEDCEMTEIMKSVIRRYETLFPGWEIMFLSIPKTDEEERKRTIDLLIRYLQ